MGWMSWTSETNDLPLERPLLEAVKIYGKRLRVFVLFVAGSLTLPVLAIAAIHEPLYFVSGAALFITCLTIYILRREERLGPPIFYDSERSQPLSRALLTRLKMVRALLTRPKMVRALLTRPKMVRALLRRLTMLFGNLPVSFARKVSLESLNHLYKDALVGDDLKELRQLSLVLKQLPLDRDQQLVDLGLKILEPASRWRFSPFRLVVDRIENATTYRTTWQHELMDVLGRTRRHEVYNRSSQGFAYSLSFRPFLLRSDSEYFDHISFWLAFYANPQATIARLEPGLGEILNSLRFEPEIVLVFDVEGRDRGIGQVYDYNIANLASAGLLTGNQQMHDELRGLFSLVQATVYDPLKPSDLFLSNYLAWSFQAGLFESLKTAGPGDDKWSSLDMYMVHGANPFVRIIV